MFRIWRRGDQPDISTYKNISALNNKLPSTDVDLARLHDYIETRIVPGTYFYATEGDKAKNKYLWMRGVAVVFGALVPVLVNVSIPHNSLITTILSLIVVISVSLEGVMHYRERWRNYRSTSSALERECYLMFNGVSPYDQCTTNAKLRAEFVKRTEAYIRREVASTLNTMTVEPQTEATSTEQKMKPEAMAGGSEVGEDKENNGS